MAWTAPMTFTAGAVLTAAQLNTHLRDNSNALRGGGLALASQAAGDLLYASSASQLARLALGTAGKVLRVNSGGSAVEYGTGPIIASQAAADLLVASDGTTWGRLAKGSALQVLRVNSGATALEWATVSFIKSIQHGSTAIAGASTSATTAITAVDANKAFIVMRSDNDVDSPNRVELTNATTVTCYKGATNNAVTTYWSVIEPY